MHKFILKIYFFIVALLCMQSFACADTIEFAQVGDVHYTLNDTQLQKYIYFLSLSVKKKTPNFVMFLGDNVDKSREEDVIGFMRSVHYLEKPYYIVLGNKDAHELSGLDKETYMDIVTAFNRNQNDEKSYYYFRPNKHIMCIVLDDTPNFAQSNHGEVPDEQLAWLENLLQKNKKKLVMIFQHSPVLPPRDEYKLSMLNKEKYQNVLNKYNNILLVSSGHYHQEAIQSDKNGIRHISAPAFKDAPHSYQLIKINYNRRSYKSPKDVEITVTNVKV